MRRRDRRLAQNLPALTDIFGHNEQRATVTAHEFRVTWRWSDFHRGRFDRCDAA